MTIQAKVSGKQTPVSGKIKKVVPKSAKPMITRKYHTASADLNREHKSTAAPPRATSGSNSKEGGRNTPDYSKLKKPDIKGLLEKRGIHGGKVNKSKLIELLQKDDAEQAKRDGTPEDYANQTVVQLKQQHRAIGLPFKANARKAELIKALEGVDAPQKSDSQDTIRVKRDETPEDYANQTVAQLKERYKARGLRTFLLKANTKKAKLIKALEDADAVELQKSDSQDTTKVKRDGTPKDYANQTVAQLKKRYKARGLRTLPLKANTKKAELIKALEDADTSEVSSKGQVVEALKQDEPLPRTQNLSIPIRSPEDTIQAQPTSRKSTTTRKIHHQIGSAVQGLQVDVDQYSILPESYKVFVRPATQFNPDIIYDAQLIPTDRDDKSTKFYHLQVSQDVIILCPILFPVSIYRS